MTALELAADIKSKKLSVTEAVSLYINAIEESDKKINAFNVVSKDRAFLRAKEIQARFDSGDNISSLAGVPIAIKDNISTE